MAQDNSTFTVSVLGEDGIIYYGDCQALFAPSEKEMIVVLAYHTPMIMKLGAGTVSIRNGRKKETLATVTGGLLYVGNNEVSVLVNL